MVTRTLIRRRLATVLRAFAIDAPENQGLHSWRCIPPYNKPPCTCFGDLVDALTAAVESPLDTHFDVKEWLDTQEVKS